MSAASPSVEPMAYVARRPCGCLFFAMVDLGRAQETADAVAGIILDGGVVERMTCAAVRAACWACEQCREPSQESLL